MGFCALVIEDAVAEGAFFIAAICLGLRPLIGFEAERMVGGAGTEGTV